MAIVYIVRCADGSYYTGSTIDLDRRLWEHNNGLGANYTRKHMPVELVYWESSDSIAVAYGRERQLHGWSRAKKDALIAGDLDKLKGLSRSTQRSPE